MLDPVSAPNLRAGAACFEPLIFALVEQSDAADQPVDIRYK
jgi:hypothetical protein